MRYLGIDYGERRIGLSYGDELGVATPLPALVDSRKTDRLEKLASVVVGRRITHIVLGYPYNMDGSVGFKAEEVDRFAQELTARFGLPIQRVDERLTSHEAAKFLKKGRDDELRRSGKLDSMAACLILQDYLDQQLSGNSGEAVFDE